jgi:chromosome partitioning protein
LSKKVLLVDNDPQANLTTVFGVSNPDDIPLTLNDVLSMLIEDKTLPAKSDYVLQGHRLDIIPSSIQLSLSEINLRNEVGGETVLSNLIDALKSDYDYVIIDTNPSIGLLTINALSACDEVIIPVSPQLWSTIGLMNLLKIMQKIQKKINPRLSIAGILITMSNERTTLNKETISLLTESQVLRSINIFKTQIPVTVKVGQANLNGQSVLDFDHKNKAAEAYRLFAKEIIS